MVPRVGVLFLAWGLAWGACPTGGGYSNTCFVSNSGSDTTGDGTIGNPLKTVLKAFQTMTAGDTMMIRAGRYTSAANTVRSPIDTVGCTAVAPCTIRSFPGEVVIFDATGMAGTDQVFFSTKIGSISTTPYAYQDDPRVSHWRFAGLRFENFQRPVFWFSSQNDDYEFRSIRIHGANGFNLSNVNGLKIFGSHIEVSGIGYSWTQGFAFSCSPVIPSPTSLPWSGMSQYVTQTIMKTTPKWSAIDYYGCKNGVVQDSVFIKDYSNAADTFGVEEGRDWLVERVKLIAPDHLQLPNRFYDGIWSGKWPVGESVSEVQTLIASDQIVKGSYTVLLIQSVSDIILTSTPTIDGTVSGTLQVINVGDYGITLQDKTHLSGSGLNLGHDFKFPGKSMVLFQASGGEWVHSNSACDGFDSKTTNTTISYFQAQHGKASLKMWGSAYIRNAVVVGGDDAGEVSVALQSIPGAGGSDYPPNQNFKPIRAVIDSPWGIAVFAASTVGSMPWDGSIVYISDVPGCTSANGIFRVRKKPHKLMMILENLDGTDTKCNAPYDWNAQDMGKGETYSWAGKFRMEYIPSSVEHSTLLAPYNAATQVLPRQDSATGIPLSTWSITNSVVASYRNATPWGAPNGGSTNHYVSAYTIDTSDRNIYWTGGSVKQQAYCGINYTKGGTSNTGSCMAAAGDLPKYEANSYLGDPGLADYAHLNVRATVGSPSALPGKGYYSGTDEILGLTSTRAYLRYLAPVQGQVCRVTTDDDPAFGSPVENAISDDGGDQWRRFVIGKSTPLAASTKYYYKVACGYDAMTGSFTTAAPASGWVALSVTVTPPAGLAGVASAVLETSTDRANWTTRDPVPCDGGCTLNAALPADEVYYRRWTFRNAAGAVLAAGQAEPLVAR